MGMCWWKPRAWFHCACHRDSEDAGCSTILHTVTWDTNKQKLENGGGDRPVLRMDWMQEKKKAEWLPGVRQGEGPSLVISKNKARLCCSNRKPANLSNLRRVHHRFHCALASLWDPLWTSSYHLEHVLCSNVVCCTWLLKLSAQNDSSHLHSYVFGQNRPLGAPVQKNGKE